MAPSTLSCFGVYDDEIAWVEPLTGEQTLHDPEEAGVYVKAFEQMRHMALTGRDAVVLIQRVAADLRDRNGSDTAGPGM